MSLIERTEKGLSPGPRGSKKLLKEKAGDKCQKMIFWPDPTCCLEEDHETKAFSYSGVSQLYVSTPCSRKCICQVRNPNHWVFPTWHSWGTNSDSTSSAHWVLSEFAQSLFLLFASEVVLQLCSVHTMQVSCIIWVALSCPGLNWKWSCWSNL